MLASGGGRQMQIHRLLISIYGLLMLEVREGHFNTFFETGLQS